MKEKKRIFSKRHYRQRYVILYMQQLLCFLYSLQLKATALNALKFYWKEVQQPEQETTVE